MDLIGLFTDLLGPLEMKVIMNKQKITLFPLRHAQHMPQGYCDWSQEFFFPKGGVGQTQAWMSTYVSILRIPQMI
jgi:hypothetical protein